MSDSRMQERLDDLETRLAFVDEAVSTLTDADTTQSRRLLALEQAVRDLRAELSSMRSAVGHDARDEPPPPHY